MAPEFLGHAPGRGTLRPRCRPLFFLSSARSGALRGPPASRPPPSLRSSRPSGSTTPAVAQEEEPTLDPPDRHGRPAMGHALGDAGGPALARRARGHVHRVVHDELALLPEQSVDPDRPVSAHDGCVPTGPPVRWLQVVRRHDDDRDRAPRRRVPHRLLREVPRLVSIRRARRLRAAGMGPLGRVRALPVLRVRRSRSTAPCSASAPTAEDYSTDLLAARDRGLHPLHRRTGVRGLRAAGAARPRDPVAGGRGALRRPPPVAAAVVRRAGRLGQAGAHAAR